jgi:hypothetical protein
MLKEGFGFVLDGEYLATCFHLINPDNKEDTFSHILMCYDFKNEADEDGNQVCTKVKCVRDFKTECDQYDFSKHTYIASDKSTDFVILKPEKSFEKINHEFTSKVPKYGDAVYTYGYTAEAVNGKFAGIIFDQGKCIFTLNYKGNLFIYFLGKSDHGFSGGLLYDSDGLVCGMIQSGMDNYPVDFVNALLDAKNISQELFDEIKLAYSNGYHIIMAMEISCIKSKYLKDYYPRCTP